MNNLTFDQLVFYDFGSLDVLLCFLTFSHIDNIHKYKFKVQPVA